MDLYLWLSYRFMDLFPDAASVRTAQKELDEIIQQGVFQITRLLKNTEASQSAADGDTTYNMRRIVHSKGMRRHMGALPTLNYNKSHSNF